MSTPVPPVSTYADARLRDIVAVNDVVHVQDVAGNRAGDRQTQVTFQGVRPGDADASHLASVQVSHESAAADYQGSLAMKVNAAGTGAGAAVTAVKLTHTNMTTYTALGISGAATFNGSVLSTGNVAVSGALQATGVATVGGAAGGVGSLRVTGPTVLRSSLNASGAAVMGTDVDVIGDLRATGAATLRSDLNVVGTLGATGAATLSSTVQVAGALRVTGATTLSSTAQVMGGLAVTGAATLQGATTVADVGTLAGTAGVSGPLNVTGSISLRSAAAVGGTLVATGAAMLRSTLTVSGAGQLASTLEVAGTVQQKAYAAVTQALVSRVSFEGSWADSTGYMSAPTVSGSAVLASSGGAVGGGCLDLSGNPLGTTGGACVDYALAPTRLPLTVSLWLKPANVTTNFQNPVSIGGSTWGANVQLNSSGIYAGFYFTDGAAMSAGYSLPVSPAPIVANAWTHVCMTLVAGDAYVFYVNGVEYGRTSLPAGKLWLSDGSTATGVATKLRLGLQLGGSNNWSYKGLIDDVRLYSVALDGDSVRALYTSGLTAGVTVAGAVSLQQSLSIAAPVGLPKAYPPAPLTATTTTLTQAAYDNGAYVVAASSTYPAPFQAWNGFGGFGTVWHSADGGSTYSSTGVYVGAATTAGYSGEYLQLQLPVGLNLTSFAISPRQDGNLWDSRSPSKFRLFGSNDGAAWTQLYDASGVTWPSGATQTFTLATPAAAWAYYRLVVNQVYYTARVGVNSDSVQLSLTLTGTNTNLGAGRHFQVPLGGMTSEGTADAVQGLIPTVTGTPTAVVGPFANTGAVAFNNSPGTTGSHLLTYSGLTVGNQFTASIWFRNTSTWDYADMFNLGSATWENAFKFQMNTPSKFVLCVTTQNGSSGMGTNWEVLMFQDVTPAVWTHVAMHFDGPTKTVRLFINGGYVGQAATINSTLYGGANTTVRLGAAIGVAQAARCELSDVRIYNRLLSTAEVQALAQDPRGALQVAGAATLQSSLRVAEALAVTGAATLRSSLQVQGRLTATGATTLQSSLGVAGLVGIGGSTTLQSSLAAAGQLAVTGVATLRSDLEVGPQAGDIGNALGLIGRLPLDGTPADLYGFLTPTTASASVTYTNLDVKVGTQALDLRANTAGGTTPNAYVDYSLPSGTLQLPVTVAVWFKPSVVGVNYQMLFDFGQVGQSYAALTPCMTTTGMNTSVFVNGTQYQAAVPQLTANQWQHYAAVVEPNAPLRIYINGALAASSGAVLPASGLLGSTNLTVNDLPITALRLGDAVTGSQSFKGLLDDFRLYNRALPASEVLQVYNNVAVGGALRVTGASTLRGPLEVAGALEVTSGAAVQADVGMADVLRASGPVTWRSTVEVAGALRVTGSALLGKAAPTFTLSDQTGTLTSGDLSTVGTVSVLGGALSGTGPRGDVLYLDGRTLGYGSRVHLGTAASAVNVNLKNYAGNWTAECWVYVDAVQGTYPQVTFLARADPGTYQDWMLLLQAGTGRLSFWYNNSTGTNPEIVDATVFPTQSWQHVAVVYTGADATFRLFRQGTLVGSAAAVAGGPTLAPTSKVMVAMTGALGRVGDVHVTTSAKYTTNGYAVPTVPVTDTNSKVLLQVQTQNLVAQVQGQLTVTGGALLRSHVEVFSDVAVTGAAQLRSSLTVAGTLAITGAATLQSTVAVAGPVAVAGSSALGYAAQLPEVVAALWGARIDGGAHEYANGVATDSSSNVYVGGMYNGSNGGGTSTCTFYNATGASGGSLTSGAVDAAYLAKYNSAGTVQWLLRLDGADYDTALSVVVDGAGDVYLAGHYTGTPTLYTTSGAVAATLATNAGTGGFTGAGTGAYMIKFNAAGSLLWYARVDGAGADFTGNLVTDGSNVYLCGNSASGTLTAYQAGGTTAGPTLTTSGTMVYVVKYSDQGAVQWAGKVDGADAVWWNGKTAVQPGGGALYVVGRSAAGTSVTTLQGTGVAGPTLANGGGTAGFVAKFSTTQGLVEWITRVDGSATDQASAVAVDAQGAVYVAGFYAGSALVYQATTSTAATTLRAATGNAAFLVKYNPVGALLWSTTWDASSSDEVLALAVDRAGAVYATGYYQTTAGTTCTLWNANGTAAATLVGNNLTQSLLIKYAATGQFQWAISADQTGGNPSAVSVDAAGSTVYWVGYATSSGTMRIINTDGTAPITVGGTTAQNGGFVVKLGVSPGTAVSTVARAQWAARIDSAGSDEIFGTQVDGAGNVIVCGQYGSGTATLYQGSGAVAGTLVGSSADGFIIKYASAGTVQWSVRWGGSGDDNPRAVAVDTQGNIFVAGWFQDSVIVYAPNSTLVAATVTATGYAGLLVKFSPSGVFQWAAKVDGAVSAAEVMWGVACTGTDVYVSGYLSATTPAVLYHASGGSSGLSVSSTGGQAAFVAKYSAAGQAQWIAKVDGTANDYSVALAASPSEDAVIASVHVNSAAGAVTHANGSAGPSWTGISSQGALLVKFSSAGQCAWVAKVDGAGIEEMYGVAVDPTTGDVYGGGLYSGAASVTDATGATTGLPAATNRGGFVFKLSSQGTYQWNLSIDATSAGDDAVMSLGAGAGGALYVTGFYNGTTVASVRQADGTVATTFPASGVVSSYLIKYSAAGRYLWGTSTDTQSVTAVRQTAVHAVGPTVYLVASVGGVAGFKVYHSDRTAAFQLPAMTAGGQVLVQYREEVTAVPATAQLARVGWAAKLDGAGADYPRRVAVDSQGNVYVSGGMAAGGALTHVDGSTFTAMINSCMYVAKYSAAGMCQWVTRLEAAGNDASNAATTVAVDSHDNVFFGAYVNTTAGTLYAFSGFTWKLAGEVDLGGSLGPYGVTWAQVEAALGPLSNTTFRLVTVLRNSSSTPQTSAITFDQSSWNGSTFTNLSLPTNVNFVSVLTVRNTNGTYTLLREDRYGTAKSAPYVNSTGAYAYSPWGDSNVYKVAFYGILDPQVSLSGIVGQGQCLAKVSSTGTIMWSTLIEGAGTEYIMYNSCSGTDVYVGGQTISNTSGLSFYNAGGTTVGASIAASAGSWEGFVAKYGGTGVAQWAARIDSTAAEFVYQVAAAPDGGVFVAGQTNAAVTVYHAGGGAFTTLASAGSYMVFVAKYSGTGMCLWASRVDGASPDDHARCAAAPDGSVYVAGYFQEGSSTVWDAWGNSNRVLSGSVASELFLVKYSGQGAVQWATTVSGSGVDTVYDLVCDPDGAVYAPINFGGPSGTFAKCYHADGTVGFQLPCTTGLTQGAIIKYGPTGRFGWAVYSDTSACTPFGVAYDRGSRAVYAALINGTGAPRLINSDASVALTLPSVTSDGGCLVRINQTDPGAGALALVGTRTGEVNGLHTATFQWHVRMDGSGNEQALHLTLDADGNVYLVGYVYGSSPVVYGPQGQPLGTLSTIVNEGGYLIKLSAAGALLWMARIDSAGEDSFSGVCVDAASGAVYVSGYVYGATATIWDATGAAARTVTPVGQHCAVLVKFTPAGLVTWVARVDGSHYDLAYGVACDSTGAYLVGFVAGPSATVTVNFYQADSATVGGTAVVDNHFLMVCKYSAAGVYQWNARAGTAINQNLVAVVANGSVYAGGRLGDAGTATFYHSDLAGGALYATYSRTAAYGNCVVRYNSTTGGVQQVFRFEMPASAADIAATGAQTAQTYSALGVRGLAVDPTTGDVYVSGPQAGAMYMYSHLSLVGSQLAPTSMGVYLVKLSADLSAVRWQVAVDATGADMSYHLGADEQGHVYLSGQYAGSGLALRNADGSAAGTLPVPSGSGSAFVAKYSAAGTLRYRLYVNGSTGSSVVKATAVEPSTGVLYVFGYTAGQTAPLTVYNSDGTAGGTLPPMSAQGTFLLRYRQQADSVVNLQGSLGVAGGVTLRSSVAVAGTLAVTGAAVWQAATDVGGTLAVTGAVSLRSAVGVSGPLSVSGSTTLRSSLGVSGAMAVSGATTVGRGSTLALRDAVGVVNTWTQVGTVTNEDDHPVPGSGRGCLRFAAAGAKLTNYLRTNMNDPADFIGRSTASAIYGASFTVELWFKPEALSGAYQTLAAHGDLGGVLQWWIRINPSNQLEAGYWNGGANMITYGSALAVNTWYHVAWVFNFNLTTPTFFLYVNGALAGSQARVSTGPVTAGSSFLWLGLCSLTDLTTGLRLADLCIVPYARYRSAFTPEPFATAGALDQARAQLVVERTFAGAGVRNRYDAAHLGYSPVVAVDAFRGTESGAYVNSAATRPTFDEPAETVYFDRAQSQYLDAGAKTFTMASTGFTASAIVTWKGPPGNYERIFDFGSGYDVNAIGMSRSVSTNNLQYWVGNGSGATVVGTFAGGIPANGATVMYTMTCTVGGLVTLYVNGTAVHSVQAAAPTTRTLSQCLIGKSMAADAFLQADIRFFGVYNATFAAADVLLQFQRLQALTAQSQDLRVVDVAGQIPSLHSYADVPLTTALKPVDAASTDGSLYLGGVNTNLLYLRPGSSVDAPVFRSAANGGTNYTWEAWVRYTAWPSVAGVPTGFGNGDLYNTNYGCWNFGAMSDGKLGLVYWSVSLGAGVTVASTATLQLHTWHHVAFSYGVDTQRIEVFLDGQPVATGTLQGTGHYDSVNGYTIGAAIWNTTVTHMAGYVYNVRVIKGQVLPAGQAFVPSVTAGSGLGMGAEALNLRVQPRAGAQVRAYPPAPLTAASTALSTVPYGAGTYVASHSSGYTGGFEGWNAFDSSMASYWQPNYSGSPYSQTAPYAYTGAVSTTIDGVAVKGEYVQLQMPVAVAVRHYALAANWGGSTPTVPGRFVLAGSTDGITWTAVDTQGSLGTRWYRVGNDVSLRLVLSPATVPAAYPYYRLVVTHQLGASTWTPTVNNVVFYGQEAAVPNAPVGRAGVQLQGPAALVAASGDWVLQDASAVHRSVQFFGDLPLARPTMPLGAPGSRGAMTFTGQTSNQFVYLPETSGVNVNFLRGESIVLEAWVRYLAWPTSTSIANLLSKSDLSQSDWSFGAVSGGALVFQYWDTAASANVVLSSGAAVLQLQTWHHVAFAYTSSTRRLELFLDGVPVGNATRSGRPSFQSGLGVVLGSGWSGLGMSGMVYQVRVTKGVGLPAGTAFTPSVTGGTGTGLTQGVVALDLQVHRQAGAPVRAYPPAGLTANSTALTALYGAGTYVASSSSSDGGAVNTYRAFDHNTDSYWAPVYDLGNPVYSQTAPYAYTRSTATVVDGANVLGEYLQLQLPVAVTLEQYAMAAWGQTAPGRWVLAGSTDGVTWRTVDSHTSSTAFWLNLNGNRLARVALTGPGVAFRYFRLIMTHQLGASPYCPLLMNWTLIGQEAAVDTGLAGTLAVTGAATLRSALSVVGALRVSGAASLKGSLGVAGGVAVRDAALLRSSLRVSGPVAVAQAAMVVCQDSVDGRWQSAAPRRFPPKALSGNAVYWTAADVSYGAGLYKVAASSTYTLAGGVVVPWGAFDMVQQASGGKIWGSLEYTYDITTGAYVGSVITTAQDGRTFLGEYLQLQVPAPVRLTQYVCTLQSTSGNAPGSWTLLGSQTGGAGSWVVLDTRDATSSTAWDSVTQTCSLALPNDPSAAYLFFRLVFPTVMSAGSHSVTMDDVAFWGHTLRSFPVAPLAATVANPSTTEVTQAVYGTGAYVASHWSALNTGTYGNKLFDGDLGTFWQAGYYNSAQPYAATAPYAYVGATVSTLVDASTVLGEWAQLEQPVGTSLYAYTLLAYSTVYAIQAWTLLGSMTGSDGSWVVVDQRTGVTQATWSAADGTYPALTFVVNRATAGAQGYYRFWRLVVQQAVASPGNPPALCDLRLHAVQQPGFTYLETQSLTATSGSSGTSVGVSGTWMDVTGVALTQDIPVIRVSSTVLYATGPVQITFGSTNGQGPARLYTSATSAGPGTVAASAVAGTVVTVLVAAGTYFAFDANGGLVYYQWTWDWARSVTSGVSGTLGVTGAVTVQGAVGVLGLLTVTGSTLLRSSLSVSGAVAITGATTFKSSLSVSGVTVLRSHLHVSGLLNVSGAATVGLGANVNLIEDATSLLPSTSIVNTGGVAVARRATVTEASGPVGSDLLSFSNQASAGSWGSYLKLGTIGIPADINLYGYAGNWTLEAWVYLSSRAAVQTDLIVHSNQTVSYDWGFRVNAAGKLEFAYWNPQGGGGITDPSAFPLNQWQHIALVYTGTDTTFRIFRQGALVASAARVGQGPSFDTGNANVSLTLAMTGANGYLAGVRISTNALYASAFTPPPTVVQESGTKFLLSVQAREALEVGANLDVTGAATFRSTVGVAGAMDVSGAATLQSALNVSGAAQCGSAVNVSGSLVVTGGATLRSTLDLTGSAQVGGTLGVSGPLTVTGAGAFRGSLAVSGNITVGGNLLVWSPPTTLNVAEVRLRDNNLEMGKLIGTPMTDITADGGGLTLKGATDKTITYQDLYKAWVFSENMFVAGSKTVTFDGSGITTKLDEAGLTVSTSLVLKNASIGSAAWRFVYTNNEFAIERSADGSTWIEMVAFINE